MSMLLETVLVHKVVSAFHFCFGKRIGDIQSTDQCKMFDVAQW